MNQPPEFHLFGPAHFVAIALAVGLPFALARISRHAEGNAFDRGVRFGLAALLAINFIGYGVRVSVFGPMNWRSSLPFQLCDWTMIAVIVALLNCGRPRWLEVIYFWGIGGSLQAVITPNLPYGFPDYRFVTFFVDHCGIVIGVFYLMATRHFRPRVGSIMRVLLWSEVYLAVTLVVDAITGVNYGFLLHKPEAFSLLSYLSDSRPIYLLQMNLLTLVFFTVLYLPFALIDLMSVREPR